MLFHDIAKPFTYVKNSDGIGEYPDHAKRSALMAREIMNRLKFNKKMIQKVTKLIEYHEYKVPDNDVLVKQFLTKFGIENIDDLYKVKKANQYAKHPAYISEMTNIDNEYERLKKFNRKTAFIKKNELKLNGKDLLDLGVKQNDVGRVLEKIYQDIINGKIKNNRDKLIDYVVTSIIPEN